MDQHSLLLFLTQMLVVLAVARLLGEAFRAVGQPPLVGEILAGLILGRTILGQVAPGLFESLFPQETMQLALFDVAAQIGILFLLLGIGLEVDVASAWKMRGPSLGVAVTGVVVPLAAGFLMAWFLHGQWAETDVSRVGFSLFVGAAVSITAISVVARLLLDLQIVKSDLGLLLLSAMAINDLLGWLVLAVAMALVVPSGAGVDLMQTGGLFLAAVAFTVVCVTYGRILATRFLRRFDAWELPSPAAPLSFVVCLGLACGVATKLMGLHPIFGFLIAGVMASDHSALSEHTRSIITQMVESIFVPLFFAGICLHMNFVDHFNPVMVLAVTAVSILGKFFGAWLGALISRLPAADRLSIGLAHMPGGSMGVLLAVVAREVGAIGPEMFVAVIFASIASSIVVGPLLGWSLRRQQGRDVLSYFSQQAILTSIQSTDRFEAIEELARQASRIDTGLQADEIIAAVKAREETVGTGAGHGVALPHARLEGLRRPMVVVGISREGIEWDAIDDQPAHFVFLILTAAEDAGSQLDILAHITRGLRPDGTRQELLRCRNASEIWKCLEGAVRESPSSGSVAGNWS